MTNLCFVTLRLKRFMGAIVPVSQQIKKITFPLSQRFGHPRVLGIPIPISLAFWASPVGDAQNADHFDFA